MSSPVTAFSGLWDRGRAFVIDDFHYLIPALQGGVRRALKPSILNGVPVVIIAVGGSIRSSGAVTVGYPVLLLAA